MKIEQQKKKLTDLYTIIPFNRNIASKDEMLHNLIQSLQTDHVASRIKEEYSEQTLSSVCSQVQQSLQKTVETHHDRLNYIAESLTPELRFAIFETLLLFNSPKGDQITIVSSKENSTDESKQTWKLFYDNAPATIANISQQLPKEILKPLDSVTINEYIYNNYPSLEKPFQQSSNPYICSILCSENLGTIESSPSQPVDFHIICDPPINLYQWNDADFFIALIQKIFASAYKNYQAQLDSQTKTKILKLVSNDIQKEYGNFLSHEELRYFKVMFPDSFTYLYKKEVEIFFEKETTNIQAKILWASIIEVLSKNPSFELFFPQLIQFFSFLKVTTSKIRASWFPSSLEGIWQERIRAKLLDFYTKTYLKPHQLESIWKNYRLYNTKYTKKDRDLVLLKHLQSKPKCAAIVQRFLYEIVPSINIYQIERFRQVFYLFQSLFDHEKRDLNHTFYQKLKSQIIQNFLKQHSDLIQDSFHHEKYQYQVHHEVDFYLKLRDAEEYINSKFKEIKVHFHGHFLHNLQQNRIRSLLTLRHTPTGGKPLKDILHCSLLIAGNPLCPHHMPDVLYAFSQVGLIDENYLLVAYAGYKEHIQTTYSQLPHLGQFDQTELFGFAYILPFILYDIIKLEQWELPQALLNAWWFEIAYQKKQLSITELIAAPELRTSTKLAKKDDPYAQKIAVIEQQFPKIKSYFHWVQFAEVYTHLKESLKSQAALCYALQIAFENMIDPVMQSKRTWADPDAPWQNHFIISFIANFLHDFSDDFLIKIMYGHQQEQSKLAKKIRLLFLEILNQIEDKILEHDTELTMSALMEMLLKKDDYQFANNAQELTDITKEKLCDVYSKIVLTPSYDNLYFPVVITECEYASQHNYSSFESLVHDVAEHLSQEYLKYNLFISAQDIKEVILKSRSQMTWNHQEGAILKLRLANIFQTQPHQIRLPLAHTIGKNRHCIVIDFNTNLQRWIFKSTTVENEVDIISQHLTHGIVQCLFSNYYGSSENTKTTFQKKSNLKYILGTVPGNPIFAINLEELSNELLDFFASHPIRTYETFASHPYVKDIFVICNVTRFNTTSLVIRSNTGKIFVQEIHTDHIPVKLENKDVKVDSGIARFFLQLNHSKTRKEFIRLIGQCGLTFHEKQLPRYDVWLNPNSFEVPVKPKYHQLYLRTIANSVWCHQHIGTDQFLTPLKFSDSLHSIGQKIVEQVIENN